MLTNGGRNMNELQHQLSESNERLKKSLDECMGVIAKQLTDLEISQLASWYSAIKVTVEAP